MGGGRFVGQLQWDNQGWLAVERRRLLVLGDVHVGQRLCDDRHQLVDIAAGCCLPNQVCVVVPALQP